MNLVQETSKQYKLTYDMLALTDLWRKSKKQKIKLLHIRTV